MLCCAEMSALPGPVAAAVPLSPLSLVALERLHGAAQIEAMVILGAVWTLVVWCLFESARTHRVRQRVERERLERG